MKFILNLLIAALLYGAGVYHGYTYVDKALGAGYRQGYVDGIQRGREVIREMLRLQEKERLDRLARWHNTPEA